MNNRNSSAGRGIWAPNRVALRAALLVFCAGVASCNSVGPAPTEYLLGPPASGTTTTIVQTGLPVVQILPAQLPDYLDSTDLLVRRGNQIVPSETGQWGERLSIGVTRDLVISLAARLPNFAVTASPPLNRPQRQVIVDIASFEARADLQVVLAARWTITDGTRQTVLDTRQVSIATPVATDDDRAVVNAMSDTLTEMTNQIATSILSDLQIRSAWNAGTKSGQPADRTLPYQ